LTRALLLRALAAAAFAAAGACLAVESDPLPLGEQSTRNKAIALYNEGVQVMLAKRYADAQRLFERALETDEGIAEAHNNLAFSLRMQSRDNFARSLKHYERAIAINPKLAQAYMYRGVLYSQMGDMKRAREDLDRLAGLDKALAARLEAAIAQAARDERDGLAPQLDAY
jgi:tetratricopeptide (TPR) repeat protein